MSKVLLGMSGGVDSSVAAALLLEQGHEVIGATLKLWDRADDEIKAVKSCCSLEDVEDARATAFKLDIPFYVLNMKELFKIKVIDYFVDSYMAGSTPNPCIACNQYVKFEAMYDKALELGMEYIATGHYARVEFDSDLNRYVLKKGLDKKKDQSYVLYMLSQKQLGKILFPLGSLNKSQVRKIARKKGFRVSEKPDSQDICFVEDGKYGKFIANRRPDSKLSGYFVNSKGEILGEHKGIANYTVGQRRHLGIAFGEPLYVIDKDTDKNVVVLGRTSERYKKIFTAADMNYIAYDIPPSEIRAKVKIRYSMTEHDAVIYPLQNGKARVEFDNPQPDISPGQAAVMYQGDLVLGGGTIEEVLE